MKYFTFLLFISMQVSAQVVISNIDDFHGATGGQNCTGTHQQVSDPGWEWNCDEGTPNCSSASGIICADSKLAPNPNKDGQSREVDAIWSCPGGGNSCNTTFGGVIAHAGINNGGDTIDTSFSWGGWFYYTDLSKINQIELDLNQVLTGSDVMIYAAQCSFTNRGGTWEFANHWLLSSNIACPKAQWTINTWHHVMISAHRCTNFIPGQACSITYDSVEFDGNRVICTINCIHDGRTGLSWGPLGLLLENVQVDMSFTTPGSMKVFADLIVTSSPELVTPPPPTGLVVIPQ